MRPSFRVIVGRSLAAWCAACTLSASALDTTTFGIPGTWALKETRAGNLCEARADFTADSEGALQGRVVVRSPCVDTGTGSWTLSLDPPTLGWALDYEKSRVIYSATQVEGARPGGTVKARGTIRAAPRASPELIRPIGSFDAKARLPP